MTEINEPLQNTNTTPASSRARIIVIQPALAVYRVPYFSRIAERYGERFTVYSSYQPELVALNRNAMEAPWSQALKQHRTMPGKLDWQPGVLGIELRRGDILVLSGQPRTVSNLALMVKANLVGARVVWWGHFWSSTSRPLRAAIRFMIMRHADAILFYTDQEVQEYRARSSKPIKVPVIGLNNGIETDQIAALRAPYDATNRPGDLLFIGRLTPKAHVELVLEALSRATCAGVKLDVIGDGEEGTALRERAEQLGIFERINWHGAITDETQIAEIANSCRIFVYPGAVGLSLMHGLTYGLPAVVHDDRWRHMPEIAAHRPGENGVTFRSGEAESLAEVISDLLKHPERLARMSSEAIETTAQTFNTDDMARRFCDLLETME